MLRDRDICIREMALDMKVNCSIETKFPSEEKAKAALSAISHEKDVGARSNAEARVSGKKLTITIEADDVVALRASMNAYMRALQVFEGIDKDEGKRESE